MRVGFIIPQRRPPLSTDLHAALERSLREPAAQHLLVELADARLGDLRDEGELVGQPPFGDPAPQVLHKLLSARACARAQDYTAQRTLGPTLVGLGDDRGLGHVWVGHATA